MLVKTLTEFAKYLRTNQFNIPMVSVEEAIKISPYLELNDQESFRVTLQQLFVKEQMYIEKFNLCFNEFFYERFKEERLQAEHMKKLNEFQSEYKKVQTQLSDKSSSNQEPTVQEQLEQWTEGCQADRSLKELVIEALKGRLGNDFELTKQLVSEMQKSDLVDLGEQLVWKAMEQNAEVTVYDAINNLIKELNDCRAAVNKIKNKEEEYLSGHKKDVHKGMRQMIETKADRLKERPMASLSKTDIQSIRDGIEKNASHFIKRYAKLLKESRTEHQIDMRKTIENSMRTFGVPFEIAYQNRKKKRTKIDILLDVSGSVVKSAEILTLFAYLIHKRFPGQVRVFTFVGMLNEVTDFFKTSDADEAIENVLTKAGIDYRGYSDYDRALRIYQNEYANQVDDQTIFFMLGDARNNRNAANEQVIRNVRKKTEHVFWLNPEIKAKWNTGDSVVHKYLPHCQFVEEVSSVQSLLRGLNKAADYVEACC